MILNPKNSTVMLLALLAAADLSRVLPTGSGFVSAAMAQDDDDGGGDDDDDSQAARPTRSNTAPSRTVIPAAPRAPKVQPVAPVQAPPPVALLPVAAPDEIVVTGLSGADLALLVEQGFAVIEAVTLVQNGSTLHRLRVPDGLTLDAARGLVRARATGQNADFNHYFRLGQDVTPAAAPASGQVSGVVDRCTHLNCGALAQIGWPEQRNDTCRATLEIGVIDTGVNLEHAGLGAAQVEVIRVTDDALPSSGETHGTAVVALIVGAEARAPGLLPEARIVAVDIFSRPDGDERADVVHLIRALDLLSQRGIRVANLSLTGPENAVLSDMLEAVAATGMLVVAAAGNAGPAAPPAWPAAAQTVLAVTAVDGDDRVYRRAQRGDHLDLAAPGVEVWSAAAVKGVKPRTGTSYSAPFATAAAAILLSRDPEMSPVVVLERMRGMTRDIGAEGADEIYGAGVMSLAGLCDGI